VVGEWIDRWLSATTHGTDSAKFRAIHDLLLKAIMKDDRL